MSALTVSSLVVAAVGLATATALGLLLVRTRRQVDDLAAAVSRLRPDPPVQPLTPTTQLALREPHDASAVLLPSSEQVLRATMARPVVRAAALAHGLRCALRPHSRDRISALVRREYRRRRKMRARAGRLAATMVSVREET